MYEEFDNGEKQYFKTLNRCKPLTKQEEKKLFLQYKNFNDISARNKLINSNLRYASKIANSYKGRGLRYLELVSEANIGLMDAIERFDINADVKIISYSKWWIMQRIQAAIERKKKMPMDELPQEDTYCDDDNENDVYKQPTNKFEETFEIDVENEINESDNEKTVLIEKMFKNLDEREVDMINMYYGRLYAQPFTLDEIGEKYNLTKERVRQIIEKTFKKLRSEAIMMDNQYISC